MDISMTEQGFKARLAEKADLAHKTMLSLLNQETEIQPELKEAMAYALSSPGKRIRAALTMWVCEIVSGQLNEDAKVAASAMEMIHAYSLVHDDLPAMDDDDLRRGQPTVHKKFGEATAILTGDALLTLAFELIATMVENSKTAIKLVGVLAGVAGPSGMVAGQMADMLSEGKPGDLETLEYIHENKTAAMFSGAAAMGAIAAGGSSSQVKAMTMYGLNIGLGFQITDDILDVTSTSEEMGKTVGKDQAVGKMTYPGLLGMEKSMQIAEQLKDDALDCLKGFDAKADILRYLAVALLNRTK